MNYRNLHIPKLEKLFRSKIITIIIKTSSHDIYPAKNRTLKYPHVTSSTFITLHQINYQNAGKLDIKILRK